MNDLSTCKRCGSEKLIKCGQQKNAQKTKWKQTYKCKNCGLKFYGLKEHFIDYEEEKFEYVSKEIIKRNWATYDEYQLNEKMLFLQTIKEVLNFFIFEQVNKKGRPVKNTKDVLFGMLTKTYNVDSARRTVSDLKIQKQLNNVIEVPCFATLMHYFNNPDFKPILEKMVEITSIPLKEIESHFSSDATGFSTSQFGRWTDNKFGEEKERRLYRKLHAMVGVESNVITSAIITKQAGEQTSDTSQYPFLLKKTAINFTVKEVSADMAYLSRKNLELTDSIGAMPLIPFKSNSIARNKGKVWKEMFYYFKEHKQDFFRKYHNRSNVEATFAMMKQKFGKALFTKNWTAHQNEILCKVVCHNICCLIRAYYCLNLEKPFSTETPQNEIITIKL
jgi:transposase